jgi:Transposase.
VLLWINVSLSDIHCFWNRYDETGQFTRRVGQGRGCKTTPQNDWNLTICALQCRSATARELQQDLRMVTGVTVSDQTLRNRLREVSLWPRCPVWVPYLTQQYRAAHLLFARSYVNWQLRQWRPMLFTDESRFSPTQQGGHQCVWRCCGEQYMPNVVQEDDRFGQGSMMVWGGISIDGRMDLVVVHGNLTAVGYIKHTATACVGCCIWCWPRIRTHAWQCQGSYSAHHQSCLASRDGMVSSESLA